MLGSKILACICKLWRANGDFFIKEKARMIHLFINGIERNNQEYVMTGYKR